MPGLVFLLAGCGGPAGWLDCSGAGEVDGNFRETNSGALTFKHGLAWRGPDGGYSVLFTDDPLLAEAGRFSPDPERETNLAAGMLGALIVGYRFKPDGAYREHFTMGSSTSSGWSGADIGRISLQDDCLRGDVRLDHYGAGAFALPSIHPEQNLAMLGETLEIDTRPEPTASPAPLQSGAAPTIEDASTAWVAVHAQLMATDRAVALQALDFSPLVAARLAQDARIGAALDRVRSQCPDPASARLDEYGDVVGESRPAPGIVLEGTALTTAVGTDAVLRLCYVMKRNGEYIDQCFPLTEDCSKAVAR